MKKTNFEIVRLRSKDFSEEDHNVANEARASLLAGKQVEWVNKYETFYGVGWMDWVKKQLQGIDCDIEVTCWCKWVDGMPWEILITPKK